MTKITRKVTASFSAEQYAELEALMKEDGQTNLTFYLVYLIHQEKKHREISKSKSVIVKPKVDKMIGKLEWNKS